jgi:predicted secreted protein
MQILKRDVTLFSLLYNTEAAAVTLPPTQSIAEVDTVQFDEETQREVAATAVAVTIQLHQQLLQLHR